MVGQEWAYVKLMDTSFSFSEYLSMVGEEFIFSNIPRKLHVDQIDRFFALGNIPLDRLCLRLQKKSLRVVLKLLILLKRSPPLNK